MGKFFVDSDFDAFDWNKRTSEDQGVIADRKVVVERLRGLHKDGLKKFMNSNGLNSHWDEKNHLTNVIYPFYKANGGSVSYVRLGYGKSKPQFKELAKYLQMLSFTDKGGLKDDIAFHYVTQVQMALYEEGWNVAIYLGKHAWFEQKNLANKLKIHGFRNEFINILDTLLEENYQLCIYNDKYENDFEPYETSEMFIEDIIRFADDGDTFVIHIVNRREIDDEMNDRDLILDFVKGEFSKLLDAYNFISWSKSNHFMAV